MVDTLFPKKEPKKVDTESSGDFETDRKRALRGARWRLRWRRFRRTTFITLIVLALLFVAFLFRKKVFITVESGQVMVVYYRFLGGTRHNEIGREGLHILAPWDEAFLYQVRTQTLIVPMTVLSKNGLEVHLEAQIRFHPFPELVPYLHRRYGPDYVKNIVTPQVTETVQRLIGQFYPDELYSSDNGASVNRIFVSAKRLIGGVFLQVEDIALFNIRLPDKVQTAVQGKAAAEQEALGAKYKVQAEQEEAERKLIEAKSLQQYSTIVTGIPRSVLVWKGIEATLELAKSPNAKVIIMGKGDSLPLVLGNVPDLGADR